MFLHRIIFFPLFCFVYLFQLLRSFAIYKKKQEKNKNTSSEQDQSQSEAKNSSVIGLDHDMILPWVGMGIINIYWCRYHFRYSLTIQVFIDTTIDTFLLIGGNTKCFFSSAVKRLKYLIALMS